MAEQPANGLDPHTDKLAAPEAPAPQRLGAWDQGPKSQPDDAQAPGQPTQELAVPAEARTEAPEPAAEQPDVEPAPAAEQPDSEAAAPQAEEQQESQHLGARLAAATAQVRLDEIPADSGAPQRGLFAPIRPAADQQTERPVEAPRPAEQPPAADQPRPADAGRSAGQALATEQVRPAEQAHTEQSRPADQARPVEQGSPTDQARPAEQGRPADQGRPAEQGRVEQGRPAEQVRSADQGRPGDQPRPATPPRGFPAQGFSALGAPTSAVPAPGTPNTGASNTGAPNAGAPASGNPAPGIPAPNNLAPGAPSTPARGFQAPRPQGQGGPGTPPRGVPMGEQTQFLGQRPNPQGPNPQGPNAEATQHLGGPRPQQPGTPPRGFQPGTPPRGVPAPGRSIDGPTETISTQALRPVVRQPDPEVDTVQIPKINPNATSFLPAPARAADEAATTVVSALPPTPPGGADDAFDDGGADDRKNRRKRRTIIGVAAAFGVFGLLYGIDLLLSQGNVPRGVAVAGVDVGGLDRTSAEAKLRGQIEPRLTKPVTVRAGDVEANVNPQEAGLTLDWPATLDQAGAQPLNPFTRLSSFFGTREVGVVTRAEGPKLTAALEGLRGKTDREPAEGTVKFSAGAKPQPQAVDPKSGQKLDVEKASAAMVADWADGKVVELPVNATPVKSTPESVRKALEEIAKPAVSGPVVVTGEGKNANLTPANLAAALKFEVDEGGNLVPKVDNGKVAEAAKPQLASTEKPGKDATFSFDGGHPVVKESVDGRGVDWDKTLIGLPEVLRRMDNRTIKAEYGDQPAKLTTDQANQLGIKEVVSRFETKGFAADSGQNIKRAAEQINGAVVKPGETFSLNARTGPRTAATGYVEAGILEKGLPGRAVGGGVSQMATTIYNAAYHAGMVDVAHQEHSNYISRYPMGREATVFQNPDGSSVIDVKFKNDSKTGIYIQTTWTSNSIAVTLWGTKTYEVSGATGPQTNKTQPNTRHITDKPDCKPSGGLEGFTVTDTRTIKEIATGKVKRETRTVHYRAQDKVVCGPPTP
ncbi:vancomycin resistance protein YoaR [Crossiella equi]|uniref:Vancomycin resistance protein YoaR n=1 Tax=Crossiella equi TaxID=130796 RepID=A0ABS5AGK5_9PSEU|nr:VanW family protein [Crossiella equi]MBP2475710.1 vancomycin resistance protein YoaR [Crossiella equi]